MAILSPDTSRDAEEVQIGILRHVSPQQKVDMLRGLHRTALSLTRQGLRRRHPEATAAELERLRAGLWLGRDLASRAYEGAPEPHPCHGGLMDPLAVASLVARALDDLGVPYFVGGSLASTLHGEPRLTRDADLVAELQLRHAEPLARALAPPSSSHPSPFRAASPGRGASNPSHLPTPFKSTSSSSSLRHLTASSSRAANSPRSK